MLLTRVFTLANIIAGVNLRFLKITACALNNNKADKPFLGLLRKKKRRKIHPEQNLEKGRLLVHTSPIHWSQHLTLIPFSLTP